MNDPRSPPTNPPIAVQTTGIAEPTAAPNIENAVENAVYLAFVIIASPTFYPWITSTTVPTPKEAKANIPCVFNAALKPADTLDFALLDMIFLPVAPIKVFDAKLVVTLLLISIPDF